MALVLNQSRMPVLQIVITAVGPKDSSYAQFLTALPANEPRFAGDKSIPWLQSVRGDGLRHSWVHWSHY